MNYLMEMRIFAVLWIKEIIECNKNDNHWFNQDN
jgi:hypothetical protein